MAELTIGEAKVTVRDKLQGKAALVIGNETLALYAQMTPGQAHMRDPEEAFERYVTLCRYAITAWDFEGSPGDRAAYEELDMPVLSDLFAMVLAAMIPLVLEEKAQQKKVPS